MVTRKVQNELAKNAEREEIDLSTTSGAEETQSSDLQTGSMPNWRLNLAALGTALPLLLSPNPSSAEVADSDCHSRPHTATYTQQTESGIEMARFGDRSKRAKEKVNLEKYQIDVDTVELDLMFGRDGALGLRALGIESVKVTKLENDRYKVEFRFEFEFN